MESGRNPDRPELLKSSAPCEGYRGDAGDFAGLDRLSRNAAFLLTLRDSGVRFAAVDLPEANDLTVGIMALVAQEEREAISRRTKEALAVAKARGCSAEPERNRRKPASREGRSATRAAIARNAERHARDLAPVVEDIRAGGRPAPGPSRGVQRPWHVHPPRPRWHVSTVTNLLERLGFGMTPVTAARRCSCLL